MSGRESGWCSVCRVPYDLVTGGLLRSHRGRDGQPCTGSWLPPAADTLPCADLTLRVRRVREGATLPRYMTAGASGMDLHAALDESVTLWPGHPVKIPTGIALAIPGGYEGQVRPRSGLAAKGVTAHLGTIDADYRGEVHVLLSYQGIGTLGATFTIRPGDRIAQLVIAPVARAELVEVHELPPTERGEGGFGSTGGFHGTP